MFLTVYTSTTRRATAMIIPHKNCKCTPYCWSEKSGTMTHSQLKSLNTTFQIGIVCIFKLKPQCCRVVLSVTVSFWNRGHRVAWVRKLKRKLEDEKVQVKERKENMSNEE